MTIDWLNPTDDVVEAKRVGYQEAQEQAEWEREVADNERRRCAEVTAERDEARMVAKFLWVEATDDHWFETEGADVMKRYPWLEDNSE